MCLSSWVLFPERAIEMDKCHENNDKLSKKEIKIEVEPNDKMHSV